VIESILSPGVEVAAGGELHGAVAAANERVPS